MIKIGVTLQDGSKTLIHFDSNKEQWEDVIKFNRESFVKDSEGYYIIVSSISKYRYEGAS